jgi:UDP:flavonoid glycosyltransferase YjiC (YdhE family)
LSSILYYISGHGYGHAVRSNQVIRALRRARPDLQIHVRSTAPKWLFGDPVFPVSHTSRSIDMGIIQPNSLEMDLQGTLLACRALHDALPGIMTQEIAFVRDDQIAVIVGDIPPACFEIAARAKIPSVAITNFTWDVIYSAYVDRHRDFLSLITEMRGFYEKASLALTLPYPCDMSVFPRRQAIPWVTRVSRLTKEQARRKFNLPQSATIVLLSFGGMGLNSLPWDRLKGLKDFFFVATGPGEVSRGNLLVLSDAQRHYEDLLRGVDVIVTKPGYGIVADVISHHVPILYTDRGEFPEYPRLVEALHDCATAEYLPQSELLAGNVGSYLEVLLSKNSNWPRMPVDGADVAAQEILRLCEGNRPIVDSP